VAPLAAPVPVLASPGRGVVVVVSGAAVVDVVASGVVVVVSGAAVVDVVESVGSVLGVVSVVSAAPAVATVVSVAAAVSAEAGRAEPADNHTGINNAMTSSKLLAVVTRRRKTFRLTVCLTRKCSPCGFAPALWRALVTIQLPLTGCQRLPCPADGAATAGTRQS
jgi:hypothetical protein